MSKNWVTTISIHDLNLIVAAADSKVKNCPKTPTSILVKEAIDRAKTNITERELERVKIRG